MAGLEEKARRLRPYIERGVAALALDEAQALEAAELYPNWKTGTAYTAGERVRYGGILYACLQAHTAQADWTPDAAVSLWARVLIPDQTVIPEWIQPDSTNPYQIGDRVTHGGKIWECTIANNVWEPGVYGWTEAAT